MNSMHSDSRTRPANRVKRLSVEAFERARKYLKTEARPLERALFEYRFEMAPAGAVAAELSRYQNQDGGFGHGLEPDLRTPSSSALATGMGLELLDEIGYSAARSEVRRAVRFLQTTCGPSTWVWQVAPVDTHCHPHAPWWHDSDGSLAKTFDGFVIIPRAQIVGLLHRFAGLVPRDWLTELTERTVAGIEEIEELGTGGGDDLVYALALAETEELPFRFRDRLAARIRGAVPLAVSADPDEWSSYCIHPLKVAPSPHSLAAGLIGDALQADLDHQIATQTADGAWDPVWTWEGAYPEAWERARQEWKGHLTLHNLCALRDYGRLEA